MSDDEWEERYSTRKKKAYFYNRRTKRISWKRPESLDADVSQLPETLRPIKHVPEEDCGRGALEAWVCSLSDDTSLIVSHSVVRVLEWVKDTLVTLYGNNSTNGASVSVLDLGCAENSNVNVWATRVANVHTYVGIDASYDTIRSAKSAAERTPRDGVREHYACADMCVDDIPARMGIRPERAFHFVSCFFAMAHVAQTRARLETFMRNVSGSLRERGRALLIFPCASELLARSRRFGARGDAASFEFANEFGNAQYTVAFDTSLSECIERGDVFGVPFALTIYPMERTNMTTFDSYLLPMDAFASAAKRANLYILESCNLLTHVEHYGLGCAPSLVVARARRSLFDLLISFRILDPYTLSNIVADDAWSVAGLFRVVVLEKTSVRYIDNSTFEEAPLADAVVSKYVPPFGYAGAVHDSFDTSVTSLATNEVTRFQTVCSNSVSIPMKRHLGARESLDS